MHKEATAQAWLGYQQSLRPCETGLTLNVDIACTAFLEQIPCIDFLAKNAGVAVPQLSQIGGVQLRKAAKAISGLKVRHESSAFLLCICCLQNQHILTSCLYVRYIATLLLSMSPSSRSK